MILLTSNNIKSNSPIDEIKQSIYLKLIDSFPSKKDIIRKNLNYKSISISFIPDNINSSGLDLSTNLCMLCAKFFKMSPKNIFDEFKIGLESLDLIDKMEFSNPGFINFKISNIFLNCIIKSYSSNLSSNIGSIMQFSSDVNDKINLEYVSPNPTGPMHIGHLRNAIFGNFIYRILSLCGLKVDSECYINDAGQQIKHLCDSVRYRILEILKKEKFDESNSNLYKGEYIIDLAKNIIDQFKKDLKIESDSIFFNSYKNYCVDFMLDLIKKDLKILGIEYDCITKETSIIEKLNDVISFLKSKQMVEFTDKVKKVKEGTVPSLSINQENKCLVFKSSQFGDSEDRVMQKSNGEYSYFANDIAYHKFKHDRGYKKMVLVLGIDHIGYASRIESAVKCISNDSAQICLKFCNIVNLIENGQVIKMSKRSGNFLTISEVLEKVNIDAVKFMILDFNQDSIVNIDPEKLEQDSMKNKVFYVQYAYVRFSNILKKNHEYIKKLNKIYNNIDINNCKNSKIRGLLINLLFAQDAIIQSCIDLNPQKITNYLYQISSIVHQCYNDRSDGFKIIDLKLNESQNMVNIFVLQLTIKVFDEIFDILGISKIQKM